MAKKHNRFKLSELDQEWIYSLEKIINDNGCWIPMLRPNTDGYTQITIENNTFMLHRLVICILNNLDYYDASFESRHSLGCSKQCYNPDHIKAGSRFDNMKDAVVHGTNFNTKKKVCPKCSSDYRLTKIKTGWNRGKVQRVCDFCAYERRENRKLLNNSK